MTLPEETPAARCSAAGAAVRARVRLPASAALTCGPSVPGRAHRGATEAAAPPPARGSACVSGLGDAVPADRAARLVPFPVQRASPRGRTPASVPSLMAPPWEGVPAPLCRWGGGDSWSAACARFGALLAAREPPLPRHAPLVAGPCPEALDQGEAGPRSPRGFLWQ